MSRSECQGLAGESCRGMSGHRMLRPVESGFGMSRLAWQVWLRWVGIRCVRSSLVKAGESRIGCNVKSPFVLAGFVWAG